MQSTPATWWPSPYAMPLSAIASLLAIGSEAFDSSTDVMAWVGRAPQDLTVTDLAFLTGTVATGVTIDARIETVTDGRPSGTLWATNTNNTIVIASSDDNVWKAVTLTASATITVGQEFAIVIRYSAGTNASFMRQQNIGGNAGTTYPMQLHDTGAGSWSNIAGQWCWILSSSGSPVHIPGLIPFSGANQTAFNSGSSPNERAMKFAFPFKARLIGAAIPMSNVAAGADFRVFLWSTGGATDTESGALASTEVIDGDATYAATSDGMYVVYFTAPYTVTAGATYYLGVRAETANGIAIIDWPIAGSAPASAINSSPTGQNIYLSTREWSAINPGTVGAWTDDTAKVPPMRLIFDQADDGAGGGGSGGVRLAGHGGFAA